MSVDELRNQNDQPTGDTVFPEYQGVVHRPISKPQESNRGKALIAASDPPPFTRSSKAAQVSTSPVSPAEEFKITANGITYSTNPGASQNNAHAVDLMHSR